MAVHERDVLEGLASESAVRSLCGTLSYPLQSFLNRVRKFDSCRGTS